ncbi:MAG: nucleoside triphosphate pyrophosphohydrolase [Acidimicrobiia bacterium]|nr:nucleoside triphosphate pyrophosphohydrolase [Acidimicrobiia bacterium]
MADGPRLLIAGLGPAGFDRVPAGLAGRLLAPDHRVVARTLEPPAAALLADRRSVVGADDLSEAADGFDDVYAAIVERVVGHLESGPVAYVVPGSALVGERAVSLLRDRAASGGFEVEIVPGESFLELVFARTSLDPFARGFQLVDARALPVPFLLHLPTVVVQVDTPLVLADATDALGRVLAGETEVTVLTDLGGPAERVVRLPLAEVGPAHAGQRVSLLVDHAPVGWPGLVQVNARLRSECPWDRRQTHHSLAKHLLEEAHEAVEAIEGLPAEAPSGEPDVAAYVELEEELGDLLLQVVFHATLAEETGLFGVEEVAEGIRRKLVRRHPHVFGDLEVHEAEQVLANWERLKQDEKERESLLDGVPLALPALARAQKLQARAASVGFDWPDLDGVVAKVREEVDEVVADAHDGRRAAEEIGDLLFSVVNLARRLSVDPEQALRGASGRFERRFRAMEGGGSLDGLSLDELDERWEAAKEAEMLDEPGGGR